MRKFSSTTRFNPRLVIGLVLVIVSIVGVVGIVRMSASATPVVVASRLLVEGQQITSTDVETRMARLEFVSGAYPQNIESVVGKVVTRSIGRGELVPSASLGEASEVIETTVVVDVDAPLASNMIDGGIVDLWAAAAGTAGASSYASSAQSSSVGTGAIPDGARLVLARARLAGHSDDSAAIGQGATRAELVVSRNDVATVLAASASDDALFVVASSGGLSR